MGLTGLSTPVGSFNEISTKFQRHPSRPDDMMDCGSICSRDGPGPRAERTQLELPREKAPLLERTFYQTWRFTDAWDGILAHATGDGSDCLRQHTSTPPHPHTDTKRKKKGGGGK